MNTIDTLFSNLIFTKTKIVNNFAFYYAKIQTLTGDGQRYVILAVPVLYAHTSKSRITELSWVSLQTRTIKDDFEIDEQVLNHKALDTRYINEIGGDQIKLYVKDRNLEQTEYLSNLPIQIVLLHDQNKKSIHQFGDSMDLRQALNTFKCVIRKL